MHDVEDVRHRVRRVIDGRECAGESDVPEVREWQRGLSAVGMARISDDPLSSRPAERSVLG